MFGRDGLDAARSVMFEDDPRNLEVPADLGLTTVLAYGLRSLISGSQPLIAALPATPETSAHIAAVGLTAFYSFFAHRHFSFRKQKTRNTGQTSARSDRKAA